MSNDPNKQPILIDNQALEYVDKFTYLGSVVSLNGGTEEDITSRLGKARAAFARMTPSCYSRKTKLRLYKSNVFLQEKKNNKKTRAMLYPYCFTIRSAGE